ncbi:aminotransferase class I/II-fold pyridoxal phosphate-dependent enzyme [Halieaceae bacterium]|nr:aminotransferase class I/II-fold pyridoxal phosphate-dependent enzyme [Halieaceae bacterium]
MHIEGATEQELAVMQTELEQSYQSLKSAGLQLDLTRGKPNTDQLALSDALDGILDNNYRGEDGTDLQNYGGLDGISEAKALFSQVLDVSPQNTLVGGNGSLSLMFQLVEHALNFGVDGNHSNAWKNEGKIKFICPVPGYDRHFSICEYLGIDMIPVATDDSGPDMDQVESLLKSDPLIKGIWCVPRFSNPTGIVYSDETVRRIAQLSKIAGPNFRVIWDNAYAVHTIYDDAPELLSIAECTREYGTQDSVYLVGSTSKVTFASAGVAFIGSSRSNLDAFTKHLSIQTIGPDKINQRRHVLFLKDMPTLKAHMKKHAEILRPRFETVIIHLQQGLQDSGMGTWTEPKGGYFISFDSLPGLAKQIVAMANEIGVKLTPAGATFPKGEDPQDSNIRLAPTFASIKDIELAMQAFVICVKLASVRQRLA